MKRSSLKHIALSLSSGLLSTVIDVTLYTFFLNLTLYGKRPTQGGINQGFEEAQKLLDQINYRSIIHALTALHEKGFVDYKRKQVKQTLTVTSKGQTYIRTLLPKYKKTRHWDGHIYLITYDVPEPQKRDRERLRKFIRSLGAGMLQDSVWLMFRNPKAQLQLFIESKGLKGVVIVSNMGKDATIGDEDLISLINRIYHLDILNQRYQQFIKKCSSPIISRFTIATTYLSILKEDPQLPFELLPQDWQGERAMRLYQKFTPRILS